MKANGKFFGVMFVFNTILGLIGFLLLWGVRALTDNSVVGIVICSCLLLSVANYINLFVVKKSKLKTLYFLFGTGIYVIFVAVPTALTMLL